MSLIKLSWYFLNLVWSMINSRLQVYTFPQIIWRSWQSCDTRRVNIITLVLQMSYMNFESNLLKVNSYYMTWERTRYSNPSGFLYKMSIHSAFWHNSNRVHGNMFIRRQQWKKKGRDQFKLWRILSIHGLAIIPPKKASKFQGKQLHRP